MVVVEVVVDTGKGEGARTSNMCMCMCIEGSVAGVDSHICSWISAGRLANWGKDGIVMVTLILCGRGGVVKKRPCPLYFVLGLRLVGKVMRGVVESIVG